MSEPAPPVVVYKLGGSLLDLPDLGVRLSDLLRRAVPTCRPVVVVGGGPAADLVRSWEPLHSLSNAASHELAIAAMDFNAGLIRILLTQAGFSVVSELRDHRAGSTFVPEIRTELERAGPDVPPENWDVTSDSLAAWLAHRIGAARLVLLKSTAPPSDWSLSTAMADGTVDPLLRSFARKLSVSWTNLRSDPFQEWAIQP